MSNTSVNELRTTFTSIHEHFDRMIEMLTDQIRDQAHPGGSMDWLQHCAKKVEAIQRGKKDLVALEQLGVEILTDTLSFEADKTTVAASGLRSLLIEVSQGMINQHLLTLTDARRLGKVKMGEKFQIQLPDGTMFNTELCEPGNRLRERGLIRQFYEVFKVEPGDRVVLKEETAGIWTLSRADNRDVMNEVLEEYAPSGSAKAPVETGDPRK